MISSEFIRDHHRSCLLAQMIVSIQRLHTDGLLVVSNRGDRQLTTVTSWRVFPVDRIECSINWPLSGYPINEKKPNLTGGSKAHSDAR